MYRLEGYFVLCEAVKIIAERDMKYYNEYLKLKKIYGDSVAKKKIYMKHNHYISSHVGKDPIKEYNNSKIKEIRDGLNELVNIKLRDEMKRKFEKYNIY